MRIPQTVYGYSDTSAGPRGVPPPLRRPVPVPEPVPVHVANVSSPPWYVLATSLTHHVAVEVASVRLRASAGPPATVSHACHDACRTLDFLFSP